MFCRVYELYCRNMRSGNHYKSNESLLVVAEFIGAGKDNVAISVNAFEPSLKTSGVSDSDT